jgi:hypothetical protein
MRELVIIESPYSSPTAQGLLENRNYLKRAMIDSLERGEAPFAGHFLYTQLLNDRDPKDRRLGMEASKIFYLHCYLVAVYTDHGISPGMKVGIELAKRLGRAIEERSIG